MLNHNNWPYTNAVDPAIYATRTDWPKISIVTPSFNQGQFIEETILSILNQNYPNLEYIIIDGGSTDNTVEIIKRYEDRITYWVSEQDQGQSEAINKGFKKSSGLLVNWINSDDSLLPFALYNLGCIYALCPETTVITGFREAFHHKTKIVEVQGYWETHWNEYLICRPHFPQDSTFFSRKALRLIGNVNKDLHYLMDVELYHKILALNGKVIFCHALLSRMNVHPLQKTKQNSEQKTKELKELNNKIANIYPIINKIIYRLPVIINVYQLFSPIFTKYVARKRFFYAKYNFEEQSWALKKFK